MRLYTTCKNCRKEITIKAASKDRFALAKKLGVQFYTNCPHCGNRQYCHVNEVEAESSKLVSIVASLIFLAGTIATFIFISDYLFRTVDIYAISSLIGVVTIPFMVYQAINYSQDGKVYYFNAKKYG